MATTPTTFDMPPDFSTAQPSDYGSQLIGLQDYTQIPVASNLNAPSLDSPLGVDPFTGFQDTSIPWAPVPPDLLSGQPLDASGGLNAVNPTLLPYVNPSNPTNGVIDPSMIAWTGKGSATDPGVSSGASLEMDGNLPLTSPNMSNTVQLATPNLNPVPLGSSIWAKIFGIGSSVALGAAKSGTAGSPNAPGNTRGTIPGTVKTAPKTAIANPISNTTMFLVLGVMSALIGAVLWSFSGKQ